MKSARIPIILGCFIALLMIPPGESSGRTELSRMSVSEQYEMGLDLARALEWYYSGEYERALPAFQRLSDRVMTSDLMFWIGASATRAGQCGLAEEMLTGFLERHPGHQRGRLELAMARFTCGRRDQAKAELSALLEDNPPPEIGNVARSVLARITPRRDDRKSGWRLVIAQGYQHDDNVTSGPDKTLIDDAGIPVRLANDVKKHSGGAWLSELRIEGSYDPGAPGGVMGNAGVDIYYSRSLEADQYDYLDGEVSAGLIYQGENDIFRVPMAYRHQEYGQSPLSDSFLFSPTWEHFFNSTISVTGGYGLTVERYDDPRYEEGGYDNENHSLAFGPNLFLWNNRLILSARGAHEMHDADTDGQSYDARHLSAALFARFPTQTDLSLFYRWSERTYEGAGGLYPIPREDRRHTLLWIITQTFLRHYFASAEISYIINDSNLELYEFDKTASTIKVGMRF